MFNSSKRSLMKEEITRRRLILSLKGLSCEKALKVAQTAYECGIKTFEVSLKSPFPAKTLDMLKEQMPNDAIIGAGDVMCIPGTDHDIIYACQHGAMFLDSPIWCDVFTNRSRVFDAVTICGTDILSEMYTAHKNDASFIRLPLLSRVSADLIKEICSLINHVRICLCGDLPKEKLAEYFEAGLSLYILDSDIVRTLVDVEDYDGLVEYFKSVVNSVKEYIY